MDLFSLKMLFETEAAADAATATNPQFNPVMAILKVAIGAYLAYMAITGKGKMIQNEYPKCSPKKYMLIMRLISAGSALMILLNAVVEALGYFNLTSLTYDQLMTLSNVFWAIGLAALVGMIVVNVALTDKKAMEAAQKKAMAEKYGEAYVNDPLRDAFVFDEEEETAEEAEAPEAEDNGSEE